MRVDAHQHYWIVNRGDYGWLTPEAGVLYRDYTPADLVPQLAANGIEKSVVVQAAPTLAETQFLLTLCEQETTLAGVVGWLDLEAPDFAVQLERLRANPYFVGIRPMLQDMEDEKYILRPQVLRSLERLADEQFPIDLLVRSQHLPHVIEMLKLVPGIKAVVDHLAKPDIAKGQFEPWRTQMSEIASFRNVYCKLSGMVTEAKHRAWTIDDFIPYVHHVIATFGSDRVMYGSDWPVCLLSASYDDVVSVLEKSLPTTFTQKERNKLFGANAIAFYNIEI